MKEGFYLIIISLLALTYQFGLHIEAQTSVDRCPPGSFGQPPSACHGVCHCLAGGEVCDPVNGTCSDYQCDRGWTGTPYCQTTCSNVTFGSNCAKLCHCPPADNCSSINGYCSSGACHNDWGGTGCQIRLPKLTSAPTVSNVTCSQAQLSWNSWSSAVDIGDPRVISYSIQQRINSSGSGSNVGWVEIAGNIMDPGTQGTRMNLPVNVTNPYDNLEYAVVCNWMDFGKFREGFRSPASSVLRPITLCIDPPSEVNNVSVTVTGQTVAVTWSSPSGLTTPIISYNLTLTHIGVGDCNITGDEVFIATWTVASTSNGDSISSLVIPWTMYRLDISAVNMGGEGRPVSRNFVSPETVPSGTVSDVIVSSISSRTGHVIWREVTCSERGGRLVYYRVTVKDDRGLIVTSADSTTTSTSISGLNPYTRYNLTVAYFNSIGAGPSSSPISFVTGPDVPSAPTDLTVLQATDTGLNLSWTPPTQPNGDLRNYRVLYWIEGQQDSVIIRYTNTSQPNIQITGLKPYTSYSFQIQASVHNVTANEGWGQSSAVTGFSTLEGFPSSPLNPTMTSRNETCLSLAWLPPATPNGNIDMFRTTATPGSRPELPSHESFSSSPSTTICNLTAGTLYNIRIEARTGRGYGPAIGIDAWTEIGFPPAPPIPWISYVGNWTAVVTIQPVILTTGPLSAYFLVVSPLDAIPGGSGRRKKRATDIPDPVTFLGLTGYTTARLNMEDVRAIQNFTLGDEGTYNGYVNKPLEANREYYVSYVVASSLDGITKMSRSQAINSFRPGSNPSIIQTTTIQPGVTSEKISGGGALSPGAIIAIAVLSALLLLLLLLLLLYCLCCRKKRPSKEKTDLGTINRSMTFSPFPTTMMKPLAGKRKWNDTHAVEEPRYVVLDSEVPSTTMNGTGGSTTRPILSFEDEYRMLPTDTKMLPCQSAELPQNAHKNRFDHILPYDRTRVLLGKNGNSPNNYINANYLPGYSGNKKTYIAAQSPFSADTICDFWQLIYQDSVTQIVFVSNLVEDGLVKCERYWFDEDDEHEYENISVRMISTETFANFVIRKFQLHSSSGGRPMQATLYHFTSWPDHGVPGNPISLLEFRNKVRNDRVLDDKSPILVHCGTGISRSAVYIAVDYCLDMAKVDKCVNVYKCCQALRQCRTMMVRTLKQYIFIYDVLFEAMYTQHTVIGLDVKSIYSFLNQPSGIGDVSYFRRQFDLMERYCNQPPADSHIEGLSPQNTTKNRFSTTGLVPRDTDRATLRSLNGHLKPDYVNGLLIESYTQKCAFIVSQSPMPNTTDDFWRLINDYGVRHVVNLNGADFRADSCAKYWPDAVGEELITASGLRLTLRDIEQDEHLTIRTIRFSNHNSETRSVKQYQFQSWDMYERVPWSRDALLALIDLLSRSNESGVRGTPGSDLDPQSSHPPVLIHCMDGATQSGLFCACYVVCQKMRLEHQVDIFHTVKNMKYRRLHFVNSLEQYKFCFKIVWDYVNNYMDANNSTA